jgi:hypothetical protein
MAATRNKFMYSEFCVDRFQNKKQEQMILALDPVVNDRPAWPVRVNAPRYPSSMLANNAIDIESSLRGIGANNYINPPKQVQPDNLTLPTVCFYKEQPLFLPVLRAPFEGQRPLGF